ncbi:hypothetical protein ACQP1G_35975 [Nocardia sp. CA-107356]|uniref:hypothetical protein n=1 Tax=Nocardia sp. CA-107356 TaxID=3239972 RepID=UPI003D90F5A0
MVNGQLLNPVHKIFDLLHIGDRSLIDLPYQQRRQLLEQLGHQKSVPWRAELSTGRELSTDFLFRLLSAHLPL